VDCNGPEAFAGGAWETGRAGAKGRAARRRGEPFLLSSSQGPQLNFPRQSGTSARSSRPPRGSPNGDGYRGQFDKGSLASFALLPAHSLDQALTQAQDPRGNPRPCRFANCKLHASPVPQRQSAATLTPRPAAMVPGACATSNPAWRRRHHARLHAPLLHVPRIACAPVASPVTCALCSRTLHARARPWAHAARFPVPQAQPAIRLDPSPAHTPCTHLFAPPRSALPSVALFFADEREAPLSPTREKRASRVGTYVHAITNAVHGWKGSTLTPS